MPTPNRPKNFLRLWINQQNIFRKFGVYPPPPSHPNRPQNTRSYDILDVTFKFPPRNKSMVLVRATLFETLIMSLVFRSNFDHAELMFPKTDCYFAEHFWFSIRSLGNILKTYILFEIYLITCRVDHLYCSVFRIFTKYFCKVAFLQFWRRISKIAKVLEYIQVLKNFITTELILTGKTNQKSHPNA